MMRLLPSKEIKDLIDAARPTGRKWRWIVRTLLLEPDEIQFARGLSDHAISQNSGR
jgi:hypothetical protein